LRRRVAIAAGLALAALVIVAGLPLAVLLFPVWTDPSLGFRERKGEIVDVEVTLEETLEDTLLREVSLRSSSGLRVDLSLRVPTGHPAPYPLVVLLGGQRTGRNAVRLVGETRGAMLAAISYPYGGKRDATGASLLFELPEMQRALLDTPPAVLLSLDYLLRQPGVDPRRVELAGVSFGAFLVAVPGTLDPRVRRVWLIHGAGDPAAVIDHGLERHIGFGPLRRLLARYLAAVAAAGHLAPEQWVGRIAPRPVIAVNARDDDALPPECIAVLHGALGEPSEILWTAGGHVHPRRQEVVADLARLVMERAVEQRDHAAEQGTKPPR
jgi:hypothetical protein